MSVVPKLPHCQATNAVPRHLGCATAAQYIRPRVAREVRPSAARQRVRTGSLSTPASDVIAGSDEAQLKELQQLFQAADLDGNGRIDRTELKYLLESVDSGKALLFMSQHGWLDESDVDACMAKYDLDRSGDIDWEEFQNIIRDGLLLSGTLQEYEQAFRAVDTSGNGAIGATELAQLFQSLGKPMPLEKVAEVFMKYDKDESGQIEFLEWLRMFRDQLLDLSAIKRFLDTNPDALGHETDKGILETISGTVSVIFTEEELAAALTQNADKLTVLFCGLTWCRPCMGIARPYERLAAAYSNSATFLKMFGNANASCKKLFLKLKIRSTPAFVMYRNGQVVATIAGSNKSKLEATIRQHLQPAEVPERIVYPPPALLEPPPMQPATLPA